ncbi:MAG: asparagine synthase (glutamine-hydrolyzing) [Pyrinomonadaceae bacterium]
MCGIFSLIRSSDGEASTAPLAAATTLARHRGSDDAGYLLWRRHEQPSVYAGADTSPLSRTTHRLSDLPAAARWQVAFGHQRLSIIDLSPAGHQPMIDAATGLALAYNGEIYNYAELRAQLQRLGQTFTSATDTEVLLAAWAEWGPACLDRLNGMFAFVLLDPRAGTVHAVRDRFGIKPLYWARVGGDLVFASEIKQIRSLPNFRPQVNLSTVDDYLTLGLLDHTRHTFDQGIEQLLGGERAEIQLDAELPRMTITRWYEMKVEPWSGSDAEAVARCRELLTDSVQLHLRADVPIGSCLSGGLDSSSIVCLAQQALRQQDARARPVTVTACFDDERCDEWFYAHQVIHQSQATAVRAWPSVAQLQADLDGLLWHMDEPFGSTSMFSQWCVFRAAADAGLKVMLDGQGADEQLAGYSGRTHVALFTGLLRRAALASVAAEAVGWRRRTGRLPAVEIALALRNLVPGFEYLLPGRLHLVPDKPEWFRSTAPSHINATTPRDLNDSLRQQTMSITLPALLRYEDRSSMAWSIESRVPFLDYRVVEFLAGLPDRLKLRRAETKIVLREAMQGIVPDAIRRRRDKLGFATPEEVWLCRKEPQWFRQCVMAAAEAAPELFDHDRVEKLVDDVIAQRRPFSSAAWRILCLGRWLININATRPVAHAVANKPIAAATVPVGRPRVASRRPLRVLVVTPLYPTPDDPQSGIFIHKQLTHLARQGIDCRVLAYRPSPPPFPMWLRRRSWVKYYWRHLGWPGSLAEIPVAEVFYQRRWIDDEDVVPAIGDALADYVEQHREYHDADVVYAHWLWTGGAAALRLRERFGWPVVAIARGSEMHEWQARHPLCREYVKRVVAEADSVLTNCEDLRDRADQLTPGAKSNIEVVYNGCDATQFQPARDRIELRRTLGLNEKSSFVFCGTIEERKGIDELAVAWNEFAATHRDWELVTIGRSIDKVLTEKLRKYGHDRVRMVGAVSHETVLSYLQAADAYVQPSRLEGLANATMEAMAVGLPVITTNTCGQRELIQDGKNGWLVPPADAQVLARAMASLAGDGERARQMGIAARQTIESRFNPQTEAAKLAKILTQAASQAENRLQATAAERYVVQGR